MQRPAPPLHLLQRNLSVLPGSPRRAPLTLLPGLFWWLPGHEAKGSSFRNSQARLDGAEELCGDQWQGARARTLRPASPRGRGQASLQLGRKGLSPGFSQLCPSSTWNSFSHACHQTRLRSRLTHRPPARPSRGLGLHETPGWPWWWSAPQNPRPRVRLPGTWPGSGLHSSFGLDGSSWGQGQPLRPAETYGQDGGVHRDTDKDPKKGLRPRPAGSTQGCIPM